jgi:hypothetical protein
LPQSSHPEHRRLRRPSSRHNGMGRHRAAMFWTILKAIRAGLRGRRSRRRWPIGAQATRMPRSVANCRLARLLQAIPTRRHPSPTIAGTAGAADIIGLGDFKPGTAAKRDGPCRTVSVSPTEAIKPSIRRFAPSLLISRQAPGISRSLHATRRRTRSAMSVEDDCSPNPSTHSIALPHRCASPTRRREEAAALLTAGAGTRAIASPL